MDTNLALPLGPNKCEVIFDYFLDSSMMVIPFPLYCLKLTAFLVRFLLWCLTLNPAEWWGVHWKKLKGEWNSSGYDHIHSTFISNSSNAYCYDEILDLIPIHEVCMQMEDITLCEGVQKGLESPAYCSGRYAPLIEMAMHHFHCLHHACLVDEWLNFDSFVCA